MKYIFLPVTLILVISFLNTVAYASPPMGFQNIQLAQSGEQSLDAAARSIKQKTGGRILSTKTVESDGQRVHKIKVLLPSGKVQTFTVSTQ